MNNCVIAIYFENHYISILCHHDAQTNVGTLLKKHHNSLISAEMLISLGDLSHFQGNKVVDFRRSWGYSWEQVKPLAHIDPEALVDYSLGQGAQYLHVFESNGWQILELCSSLQSESSVA